MIVDLSFSKQIVVVANSQVYTDSVCAQGCVGLFDLVIILRGSITLARDELGSRKYAMTFVIGLGTADLPLILSLSSTSYAADAPILVSQGASRELYSCTWPRSRQPSATGFCFPLELNP